ncbi:MAG: hypothetical protein K0U78_06075 [Actinomycetia bacterium]|nr:hypothetical protein [Actinomycetes bacterium]
MGAHQNALRQRMKYTGESWRALNNDTSIDHMAAIPEALDAAQRDLESAVFEALNVGYYFRHAYGVDRVRIRPDGTIALHVDNFSKDGHRRLAPALLAKLLPDTRAGELLHGEPGVRVHDANGSALVLTTVEGSPRVSVLVQDGDWRADLDALARQCEAVDGEPAWSKPEYTDAERAWLCWEDWGRSPDWVRRVRAASTPTKALGSGLLRRVAAFHRIGEAHALSAWTREAIGSNPDEMFRRWNIEVVRDRPAKPDHDHLVDAMCAPFYGLPLREVSRWCSCTSGRNDSSPGRQCTVTLVTTDHDHPVELQLRFLEDRAKGKGSVAQVEAVAAVSGLSRGT